MKKYGALLPISGSANIDLLAPAPLADEHRAWNIQLFRSITSDSAQFFDAKQLKMMNSKKGRIVDSSIAQAYIQVYLKVISYVTLVVLRYFSSNIQDDSKC